MHANLKWGIYYLLLLLLYIFCYGGYWIWRWSTLSSFNPVNSSGMKATSGFCLMHSARRWASTLNSPLLLSSLWTNPVCLDGILPNSCWRLKPHLDHYLIISEQVITSWYYICFASLVMIHIVNEPPVWSHMVKRKDQFRCIFKAEHNPRHDSSASL